MIVIKERIGIVSENMSRNLRPALTKAASSARHSFSREWIALGFGLLICLLLLAPLNAGHAADLPTNVCHEPFCGPAQQGIWNRFQDGTGLDLILIPSVYSGTCYHNSPAYDPNAPQFVGVLIDELKGEVVFDGRFSFYRQKHPYAHLNVDTARERFPEIRKLKIFDSFAYAETADSLKPFRYWLRQDADTGGLLLVGYFGYNHTMLCTLDRNPR